MTQKTLPTDIIYPDLTIGEACHSLLERHEKISLRSVSAKIGVAHTTLARNPQKREQIERARQLQQLTEDLSNKHRGGLSERGILELTKAKVQIAELEAENALLIASHRAMIMAVGEMGGMRAWRRFFEKRTEILNLLTNRGAVPENVIDFDKSAK